MDKLKISLAHEFQGQAKEVLSKAEHAGWSDDPGTGLPVMLVDARGNPAYEVPNPMQFAPPIGFEPTPPVEQLIRDRVRLEVERLRGEDEIDSLEDADDFDVPDELAPLETMYEVIAMEKEAPKLKTPEPTMEERARQDAEYMEMVDRERVLKRRHREAALKKQADEANEELKLYSEPRSD